MSLPRNELIRKLLHIGAGIIPLICLRLEKWQAVIFWGILLSVATLVEYWRRKRDTELSKLFYKIYGPLLRDREREKLVGVTYLFTSGLLVYIFFPKEIASLSVLYLTVGDGLATIVGMTFGRHSIGGKTLEGSLAFIIPSFLVSFVVPSIPIWVRGTGAIFAGILEAVKLPENDNFWIPLGTSLFMWIIMKLL